MVEVDKNENKTKQYKNSTLKVSCVLLGQYTCPKTFKNMYQLIGNHYRRSE